MLAFAPTSLTPVLATAGIGWMYYRRIRRQFGRQQYQPRRVLARLALLALVLVALVVMAAVDARVAIGVGIGLAAGAVLAWLSLRHTVLECVDGQGWYTPHPWIGATLSLLLLGRLAWRFGQGGMFGGVAAQAHAASPLTLGIAATLVGFYLINGAGLAWRMRALRMSIPHAAAASPGA